MLPRGRWGDCDSCVTEWHCAKLIEIIARLRRDKEKEAAEAASKTGGEKPESSGNLSRFTSLCA
jgi:hypothetical protein